MSLRWSHLLVFSLIAVGAYWTWRDLPVEPPPGVLAPQAPRQSPLESAPSFEHGGYRVTPLAKFSLRARVLGKERYRFDREADLVPVDLALGWGAMSDSRVLDHVEVSQSGRYYFWRAGTLPIPRKQVTESSANMHLIAANGLIEGAIDEVRPGQVVELQGSLVRVESPDGWRWTSSLRRDDSGRGACELVWVERLEVDSSGG